MIEKVRTNVVTFNGTPIVDTTSIVGGRGIA